MEKIPRHNIPMTLILTRKIRGWQKVVMLAGNYDRYIETIGKVLPLGIPLKEEDRLNILCQDNPKNFIL
jgi:hypothetical protein